eukprot:CAMPEP_0202903154 /NCGR_PEP_ID=MMETSP1392-20130828/22104_1 /ASSEMBLY_ACC=CAM_ASM_000868 /TAXON_ID=225041 /ORGANISM="Chlamydomonas chlamydogama, Strain SAG 11-48b" /LENGTH=37 /DNA_ID= /DNA_START= /DNA_END= /DNA_ORIENTATION=
MTDLAAGLVPLDLMDIRRTVQGWGALEHLGYSKVQSQ